MTDPPSAPTTASTPRRRRPPPPPPAPSTPSRSTDAARTRWSPSTTSPWRSRSRKFTGDHGPVGLRQEHADALPRRARHAHVGRRVHRRHVPRQAQRQGAHRAAPQARRVHLPGVQPDPDADRRGEHQAAAAARRRRSPTRQWFNEVVDTVGLADRLRTARASCPAANSSASPSPAPSTPAPTSSSPTSRPATSTRAPAPRSSTSCAGRCASTARRS